MGSRSTTATIPAAAARTIAALRRSIPATTASTDGSVSAADSEPAMMAVCASNPMSVAQNRTMAAAATSTRGHANPAVENGPLAGSA
jgi:cobalamin biosynthesis protein CbiG